MGVDKIVVLIEHLFDGAKACFAIDGIRLEIRLKLGEGFSVDRERFVCLELFHPCCNGFGVAPRELEELTLNV